MSLNIKRQTSLGSVKYCTAGAVEVKLGVLASARNLNVDTFVFRKAENGKYQIIVKVVDMFGNDYK